MKLLLVFLSLFPLLSFSQIKIDDVGDGWKEKVQQSLILIQQTDTSKYNLIVKYCDQISYTLTPFSTIEGTNVILLPSIEIKKGNINDIASAIVHESLHLYFLQSVIKFSPNNEEIICYTYELDFLLKIPNVEFWLIEHTQKQIEFYAKD